VLLQVCVANLGKARTNLCVANLAKAGTDVCYCRYVSPIWERLELMCGVAGMYHQFEKGGN